MNDEYNEALAEEMGHVICPIVGDYTYCDENCEQCDYYKGFVEIVEKSSESK